MSVPSRRPDSSVRSPLVQELNRRLEQIEALGRVAHALTGVDDAGRTMHLLAAEGLRVFTAQRAAVYLFDHKRQSVECMVALGLSQRFVEGVIQRSSELPSARAVMRGEPHFLLDARSDPAYPLRSEARQEGIVSVAALPLVFAGEAIGYLAFYHDSPREYSADERRVAAAFADQAALAIGKSRLLDQVSRVKREWQSAFDGTGAGLAIVDAAGQIVRGNRFLAGLAKVDVTDLPGMDFKSLFPNWPPPRRDPLIEAAAVNLRVSTLLEGPAGQHLVLTATPRPEGGLVVAIDDLSELVRLEERFTRVFQTTQDAIMLTGPDERVTFANRAAMELFGLPLGAIMGTALERLLPRPPLRGATPATRYECDVERTDGVRHIAVSRAPLEERGEVTGAVTVARDVTEERVARQALGHSEARYRALFASAPLAIFTLDSSYGFQSVNRAAVRMAGYPKRVPDLRLEDFLLPAEIPQVRAHFEACFRGETRDLIFHFRRADGAVRDGAAISVPLEEAGGAKVVLTIARDVTDEHHLRERLTHSEKMAALGQLVSGVAHELNNPLAGIAALAQSLALDPSADEETAKTSTMIRREAVRAARIVNDLLIFARQRPLRREEIDLNAPVREALETLPLAAEAGVQWDLALAPGLPRVSADPEQIRQVVSNLLTNAVQAMRQSPLKLGRIRTYETPDRVGCEVADSGSGIAPEAMPRIFEPFFTTKGVGEGTGLGLSISHGIIRAHGGDIMAENRPEGGARFWFELTRASSGMPRSADA